MNVYKIMFEGNSAVSVELANYLQHSDIGFHADGRTVQWFAVEGPDEETAFAIAHEVVSLIWGEGKK